MPHCRTFSFQSESVKGVKEVHCITCVGAGGTGPGIWWVCVHVYVCMCMCAMCSLLLGLSGCERGASLGEGSLEEGVIGRGGHWERGSLGEGVSVFNPCGIISSTKLYSNVNNVVDETVPKENPYGYGDESIYACVCPSRHEQV